MSEDAAATLKAWGDRFEEELGMAVAEECESLERSLSLVAAVEAVLALADEWDAKADYLTGQITPEDLGGTTATVRDVAGRTYRVQAQALREAITAALTGEERSDGT